MGSAVGAAVGGAIRRVMKVPASLPGRAFWLRWGKPSSSNAWTAMTSKVVLTKRRRSVAGRKGRAKQAGLKAGSKRRNGEMTG